MIPDPEFIDAEADSEAVMQIKLRLNAARKDAGLVLRTLRERLEEGKALGASDFHSIAEVAAMGAQAMCQNNALVEALRIVQGEVTHA